MISYRIHRLKEHLRQAFRNAPHVSGPASVKPRDYEAAESVEADSAYAAYFAMKESGSPLEVGDMLEAPDGALSICKFVGFEEARWVLPEAKPAETPESAPPDHPELLSNEEAAPHR